MHGDGVVRAGRRARANVRARWRPAARQASTVRRDACHCISAGAVAEGANGVRMRFVSGFAQFITGRAALQRSRIFGTFVALLQEQYRLSGSPELSRSRRISRGESRAERRPFGRATRPRAVRGTKGQIAMDHRIASARPLGRALTASFAAAGLLAAAMVVATPALAQQPQAGAKAGAAKPAPRQSRAGRSRPQPRRRQQAAAEQPPQLMYSPWMKVCGKGPETNNKQVCVLTKDGRLENGMPVAIVQLFEPEGEAEGAAHHGSARHAIAARHPHDHRSGSAGAAALQDLLPGRLHVRLPGHRRHDRQDEEGPDASPCRRSTCRARRSACRCRSTDFAKAYDGPPTDPKVVEEQQRKLQEELQKRAEDARKKLEAQQPATAAAPAPAPRRRNSPARSHEYERRGFGRAFFVLPASARRRSIQSGCCAGDRRRCRPARTLRRPADGGSACRRCRAAGSARRHRRCIRSPRSRRTDDRTAGPCAGARRRGSTATIPRCCRTPDRCRTPRRGTDRGGA